MRPGSSATPYIQRGAVLRRPVLPGRGGVADEAWSSDESEDERAPLKNQRGRRGPVVLKPLTARLTQLTSAGAGAQLGFAAVPGAPLGEGAEVRRSRAGATMAGNAKVSPMETRQSHCNAPDKNAAVAGGNISNQVTTAKYTLVTFLPINLTSQFSRLANVYFLVISCLQLFTPLSPTSKYSTAAPFAFVLLLNMVRELFEDSARHKADQEVNDRLVEVVRPSGSTESVPWRSLVLGDLVWVKANNEFPADLVLIASSGDQGMCYIDTCNLDGTNSEKFSVQVNSMWYM